LCLFKLFDHYYNTEQWFIKIAKPIIAEVDENELARIMNCSTSDNKESKPTWL